MGLSSYHSKRNFKKTPEPKGQIESSTTPLRFVIQKHDATRLHYDFRLEAQGVLKSWAVPKGPSLNPSDRRLAMMVEDHPLSYRTFEGIIPKDNYGAGEVIVWDEGFYAVYGAASKKEMEQEVCKQIESGKLKIVLYGKKLKGEFSLIRQIDEEKTWFLLKSSDDYVSDTDVRLQEQSVISGKTLEDLKNKKDKVSAPKLSLPKNAKKSQMPHDIKPMLATKVDQSFDKEGFLYEIKWDGYRAIAEVEKDTLKLYSRNGNDFSQKYAPITKELGKLKHSVILDGEVVVLDEKGNARFQYLQHYAEEPKGQLMYKVFDILYIDGYDLASLTLSERKNILRQIIPSDNSVISYSDHIECKGIEFFELSKKLGIEGIMAKDPKSVYLPGIRTTSWLKIKTKNRQEALICGYTEPRGGRKHIGALVLGVYENEKLRYIGHTGTGIPPKDLFTLQESLDRIKVAKSPFEIVPKTNAPVTWVKPIMLCEVEFSEWTQDGHMRHPVFVGLRSDKKPDEVTKEQEIKAPLAQAPEQKFTNLTKLYWPEKSLTKGDLLAYYDEISEVILPYLKDRPQNLNRFPNGIHGSSFYQKNFEDAPSWIETTKVYSESDNAWKTYLLCQRKETLLYLANLGCIEINPWNSRTSDLEKPDYFVLDLDPEDIEFTKVVETALVTKKVLDELHIPSFCKTSGKTGFHIYVPLAGKYSYDIVRPFAELLATLIHKRLPEITSIVRDPKKRQKKVYVDFLQNRFGQTLAAPYSVRPTVSASVSTPLYWDEVTPKLDPETFTIKNTVRRLEKEGDLWQGTLGDGIEIEKVLGTLGTYTSK